MRRFFTSLNVLDWLLVLVTVAATLGFITALNTWYGGFNAPGWPWHIPDRAFWTRADYMLIPFFALCFFLGASYCSSLLGLSVFRDRAAGAEDKAKKRKP